MKFNNLRTVIGVILILAGGLIFLDQYLKTGWLSLLILPAIGMFLYLWGIKQRRNGLIIAGGLLGGIGAGMIGAWGTALQLNEQSISAMLAAPQTIITQLGLLLLKGGDTVKAHRAIGNALSIARGLSDAAPLREGDGLTAAAFRDLARLQLASGRA